MLYIEEDEKVAIPKKYHAINNQCAIIYDQLTDIITHAHYKSLIVTNIELNEQELKLTDFSNAKLNPLGWLVENKFDKDLVTILTKNIALAVLADFVNFMYESMSCAKRGKMTVAYALLRKPMTDELLILEQLLYDKEDFIKRIYHEGDPTNYDPSHANVDKRAIIKNALSRVKSSLFFSEDLIYDLRYNKACVSGINGITNQAIHIVTRDKNYKTENQNLNFVFSDKDSLQSQFQHYYYFVPYLLTYAAAITDELIFQYLPGEDYTNLKAVKEFRRFIALVLWKERIKTGSKKKNTKLISSLKEVLKFNCLKCNHVTKLERSDYELFLETECLLCEHCGKELLISGDSLEPIRKFLVLLK